MEGLNFGWDFFILILFVLAALFIFGCAVNYLFIVLLSEILIKLIDKTPLRNSNNLFVAAIPYLIVSSGLYWTAQQFSWKRDFLFLFNHGHFEFSAYIVGMTCLGLNRYTYTQTWKIAGRVQGNRKYYNFLIWTATAFLLSVISKFFPLFYFSKWEFFPVLIAIATYIILKSRNIVKSEVVPES